MILDSGICSVYHIKNNAAAGDLPKNTLVPCVQSWYKELNFETAARTANLQEAVEISARIRIMQSRAVSNHDIVKLDGMAGQYEILRAWHGIDPENGQPITDLTLKRLVNVYDLD